MRKVVVTKNVFEEGDILVMGWNNSNRYCEWICELAEDRCEDEIINDMVEHEFGFYTKFSEGALSNNEKTIFVDGVCETQTYFREPTTEELVEFYKTKADYYQEKAKKLA